MTGCGGGMRAGWCGTKLAGWHWCVSSLAGFGILPRRAIGHSRRRFYRLLHPRDVVKPGGGRQVDSSDRGVLAGLVERVTFHNPEYGFCVLRTGAHRGLVTVVGYVAMVAPGEWITVSGEWVNDRTHGQQFKARFIRTAAPSSVKGIEK